MSTQPSHPTPSSAKPRPRLLPALLSLGLAALLALPAGNARAESYSLFEATIDFGSKYVSEGMLELDEFVYGAGLELSIPLFPMYIGYSTLRGGSFHEDEIALGFSTEFVGNEIDVGFAYVYGQGVEEVNDSKCPATGACPLPKIEEVSFDDNGEFYLELKSAEFGFTRIWASYAYHFVNEGAIYGLGVDFSYDINDYLYFGIDLAAESDAGYAGIGELSGFYHLDYGLNFGVALFGESGLELAITYITPLGDGKDVGVTEEVVYNLGFLFAF